MTIYMLLSRRRVANVELQFVFRRLNKGIKKYKNKKVEIKIRKKTKKTIK